MEAHNTVKILPSAGPQWERGLGLECESTINLMSRTVAPIPVCFLAGERMVPSH